MCSCDYNEEDDLEDMHSDLDKRLRAIDEEAATSDGDLISKILEAGALDAEEVEEAARRLAE